MEVCIPHCMYLFDVGDDDEVISEAFNLKVTRSDISRLQDSQWLNDEVINFYINIIMERNKSNHRYPKVFIFNTFFYPLLQQGYSRVRRWAKKVKLSLGRE